MKERISMLFMTIVIIFTTITPGLVPSAEAAGGTVTKSYTATMDTMEINGHIQYDGIHDNNGDGFLSIGRSNDEFGNVRQRAAITFDLGVPEGNIVSAELVLTVATVIRNSGHTLYMEVRGSAANGLNYTTFPSLDTNSPYADKFTAKSIAEVPVDTYLQNQSITLNVKSAVDAFTDISDRKITFMLNGNETDAESGWFSIHSLETYGNAAYRPKLVVTYETGPVNTPPTGSFTIMQGAATSNSTVNLSITGLDPDAGDRVTHMRFANSEANLSAASWLPFSNTATFSLSGGDGSKTIYMQLRDSNNGISVNSSQTILLDQTAPTGTLIINEGATWTKSNTVTLKGTYTDGSGSGVEHARLSNINGSWQTSWFNIADLNEKSWVLPAGEGVQTVYIQYKDRVGNSSSTISSTITVDTIAPVITNVVNNQVYNSKVNPLFDEGSGLLNGNPYTSGTDITQDGTYTLIVTDPAGNSATVTFKIDTIPPVVTGVTNGGLYNTNRSVSFNKGTATLNGAAFTSGMQVALDGMYTLVVTDAAGNVTTVSFTIDTVAPIITGVTNGESYKEQVTINFNKGTATLNGAAFANGTEIDQDGLYTLVVTDAAGNETIINFQIDTTAPTGTVSIQAGAEWTNVTDATLTLTSNDGNNGSGVVEMRFSSNGSDWGSWEPSASTKAWSFATGDGEKTVYVQFKDKAGNVSGTINDVIKLDQTIPTGKIVINSGATTTNSKLVTLTLTSSDGAGSGVTEMRFSEDNLTWLDWENVLPAKNWSFTGSPGLKKLYVQFRDAAGNVSEANMASITYQESSGSNFGFSGSEVSTDIASSADVVISTANKSENAAKVDIKMVEGKKVTTIFLEEAQLQGILNDSGNKPVITITVRNNSDAVNWEMNAALLQSLENRNAIIQLYTENVVYTLPLVQVSVNKWLQQLGADIPLKDMKIKVEMIHLPASAFVFKHSGDGQVSLAPRR
ncbi:hypothetical protein EBB07_12190 [Paenibacillaceae bacterium]|nr:hypothetical protein EBB07_12190 [Paenibacillaceae bacterium]